LWFGNPRREWRRHVIGELEARQRKVSINGPLNEKRFKWMRRTGGGVRELFRGSVESFAFWTMPDEKNKGHFIHLAKK